MRLAAAREFGVERHRLVLLAEQVEEVRELEGHVRVVADLARRAKFAHGLGTLAVLLETRRLREVLLHLLRVACLAADHRVESAHRGVLSEVALSRTFTETVPGRGEGDRV